MDQLCKICNRIFWILYFELIEIELSALCIPDYLPKEMQKIHETSLIEVSFILCSLIARNCFHLVELTKFQFIHITHV